MHTLIAIFLFILFMPKVHAAEDSLYEFHWLDPDKAVYVLQNKTHTNEHKFFAEAGYVKSLTAQFQDTQGVILSAGYNWHEEWGIEVLYLNYSNQDNSAFRTVRYVSNVEPFVRRHTQTLGTGVIWSPFYGKINTFNQIVYFTWNFSAGLAQVTTQNNLSTVTIVNVPSKYKTESTGGAYIKSLIKFNLSQVWSVGVGYLGTMYKAAGPKAPTRKDFQYDSDIFFNVGWMY